MEAFLTLHFVDGSRLKFQFDVQGNEAARKLKLDQFMASEHLVIESDGSVMIFPVVNIKHMTFSPLAGKPVLAALPRHAITGASIRD